MKKGGQMVASSESRLESIEAGITIPLMQSAITGAFVGVLCAVCGLYFAWREWFIITVFAWLGSTFAGWLYLHRRWLFLTAERFAGRDFDGDGVIGSEPGFVSDPEPRFVRVDISQPGLNGSEHVTVARLPVPEQDLSLLAVGLLAGRPFSERLWTGKGRPLSVSQFRALRDEMHARGIIEPVSVKDVRQGYKLTRAGVAVMRHFSPAEGLEFMQ
jgi:hypothetical protein